jgi:ribonuclease J
MVKIIPLGGFDKIGMNMTLIEYEDSIIAIDCGTSFPPGNLPGIAASVPDVSYIKKNLDKFKGIILTHGHEDHIGAIPYIIKEIKAPIYGTPLTIALVENKLKNHGLKGITTKAIKMGSTIVVGGFKIEFIRANHSIPDSAMLAISTPEGTIVNTGDFKFDMSCVNGEMTDINRLTVLGSKGVLAVISDSTNAIREGISKSEHDVIHQLDYFLNIYKKNRLIITSFASNMYRIQQILNLGKKYNRKIALDGTVMLDIFSITKKLKYIEVPEDILIDASEIDKYPDEELIILTTGNHGEAVQCISGIISGMHPYIKIRENDAVLFSSIPIRENEIEFSRLLNKLEENGVSIEFEDIHATGHACAEELKLLYTMLRPKFVIPAHGEYRYRRAARNIARSIGILPSNILMIQSGDIVEMTSDSYSVKDRINLNEILIDGYEKSEVDPVILQNRKQMHESGVVIMEMCIDKKSGRYASKLKITSRGFAVESKSKNLYDKLEELFYKELSRFVNQGVLDERAGRGICAATEEFIRNEIGKTPIVIVNLIDVMV